ncbi:DUF1120 domain-containing protein [Pseudomonas sp. RC2C2]|uniref:DUF1120 domain-containing protein n=1 Tax=Pseudomonas sp. RC2C2 TaxID=2834408 RepID=UPI001BCF328E|nr:DUF1120 domain-containing protein [Pseudomonas sp. RC2C2]
MKKSVLTLAALLSLATANAMAATTDLSVTGTITPAACTPTLSNGGVVDYGVQSLSNLEETSTTYKLPAKSLNFAIECSAPAAIAVIANDNRRESAGPNPWLFGLGMYEDQPIGIYYMHWDDEEALIDGGSGMNLISRDAGNTWDSHRTATLVDAGRGPDERISFSNQTVSSPTAVTSVTMNMKVTGHINKDLSFNDNVTLDGSATIEIVYL